VKRSQHPEVQQHTREM